MFDPVTLSLNVDPLILSALKEDITSEDVSTNSVMPERRLGTADLICKDEGVICGLQVFARTFALLDPDTQVTFDVSEGDVVTKGQHLATVTGDIRAILSGERTALNYLQRMSGVATCARQMSELLEGTGIRLLDTRKTTPNNRIFQKYAVVSFTILQFVAVLLVFLIVTVILPPHADHVLPLKPPLKY